MKQFLSKFLDAEQIANIETAFKEKNPESTGLPIYIPKTRFDEVDSKRKVAEESLKQVPADWQDQLNASAKQLEDQQKMYEDKLSEQQKQYEAQLSAQKAESERTAKVYGAGARNVKAVMALLDPDKPIDAQLAALQKTDSYLFTGSVPKGTGKGDNEHGGEGDDKGKDHRLSMESMYRAVGLTPHNK